MAVNCLRELTMSDQVLPMLEMAGDFVQEFLSRMKDYVVQQSADMLAENLSSNDDFIRGVIMAAAFVVLIRQVYMKMRTRQQLPTEPLVSGIREPYGYDVVDGGLKNEE